MSFIKFIKTYFLSVAIIFTLTACGGSSNINSSTLAQKTLQNYIASEGSKEPTIQTYIDAGASVSDLHNISIDELNSYLKTLSIEDVDTNQEVAQLVAKYSRNHPPVAYAGKDINITKGNKIKLICKGTDSDKNSKLSYSWYQGSTKVSQKSQYIVPSTMTSGDYIYICKVTDEYLRSSSDSVKIHIQKSETISYTLTYTAGNNGALTGETTQTVEEDSNSTAVTAVPSSGYHFVKWSDGKIDNPRVDNAVHSDINVTAVFTNVQPPVISLNGKSYVHLTVGDSYEDAGATAKDNSDDSDITDDIVVYNPVDTTKAGRYIVSYNVSDSIGNRAKEVYRTVRVSNRNLLEDKNPNVNTLNGYVMSNEGDHNLSNDSHTDDGSGSIKIVSHWYTHSIKTPTFTLEEGKHYTISAYMKAVGLQKGQNVMVKISKNNTYPVEMNWNVSKPGEWEEIVIPYIAPQDGEYNIAIFTYRYSISTDGKLVKGDGSNLDRNTTVYFDDFRVVESEGIDAREPYTQKDAYESSNIRIDALGNWSVKENGVWKNIFPKFAYQDFYGDFNDTVRRYKAYGFTGITNITSMEKLNMALEGGLKYNGIQINNLSNYKELINNIKTRVNNGELNQTSILMYDFDNEGVDLSNFDNKKSASDWIKENDFDSNTQSRARPIYMLNGIAEGVTRNYNGLIDATGSYVYQSGEGVNLERKNPVNTLGILQQTHNQKTPVTMMQLQCYYHDTFVPAIFKGIISGAKALNFWRGGTDHLGCKEDFRENVWADAIKGEDGVFARIDKMLPIIREPLITSWSATVDKPLTVAIGTREHKGRHYIILSNFSGKDQNIHITLDNAIDAKSVKDYFTNKTIATITDKSFDVKIGHYNSGYLVIEIE